jgi:hypothetical protein
VAVAVGVAPVALLVSSASASTPRSPHANGTGTMTLVGAAGKSHTRSGAVSCRVVNGRYVVRMLAGRRRHGMRVRLVIGKYTGAGSYTGRVRVTHMRGARFRGRVLRDVPVTVTSTGGSFKYAKTLSGKHNPALAGKTVSVTGSWTCTA